MDYEKLKIKAEFAARVFDGLIKTGKTVEKRRQRLDAVLLVGKSLRCEEILH